MRILLLSPTSWDNVEHLMLEYVDRFVSDDTFFTHDNMTKLMGGFANAAASLRRSSPPCFSKQLEPVQSGYIE